jgi:fused signal recognition particle receptor
MFSFFKKKKEEEITPQPKPLETDAATIEQVAEVAPEIADEVAEVVAPQEVVETAPVAETSPEVSAEEPQSGWLNRLKSGLSKSAGALTGGITDLFTKRKLDNATLEELEDLLIMADMGSSVASELVEGLRAQAFDKEISSEEVRAYLAGRISEMLIPVAKPWALSAGNPHVVLVVGVNGNGKTTTIGKLAAQLRAEGKKVLLAAGDTFRAAAVEQLQIWGTRTGCEVVAGEENADSASVAFRALEKAKADGVDVLLIDTAGRLHNKQNLMQELEKIIRVLRKIQPDAPHTVLQVLDATTGQNAISQVKAFREMVAVNGLVVTKLDGTAKAGVVVALAQQFAVPIHAIGVGEGVHDFRPFEARDFAENLVGLAAA